METIFALSSGKPPAGIAVFRLSGPKSRFAVETICGDVPVPRQAVLRAMRDPKGGHVIDTGLCLWLPGPGSFTGEDSAELHVHGGRAVVQAMTEALGGLDGVRLAEAGEFTRRAFENGRVDLTELEGLADLVAAQTEMQRRQAVAQAGGALREKLESWRDRIVRMRAMIEAGFDFSDEEDVPDDVGDDVWDEAGRLAAQMRAVMEGSRVGEIVRDGFQIVLMGPPNAGKSSLLNALANRDVAIVDAAAGTTRDLIEVHLDLDGYPVTLVDTAGMREADGAVEREGMRRAAARARDAEMIVWLWPAEYPNDPAYPAELSHKLLVFRSKDDDGRHGERGLSVVRYGGIDALVSAIRHRLPELAVDAEAPVLTRARHRAGLEESVSCLERAASGSDMPAELRSEELRLAGDWIGKLTGVIETEHLLDVIFREFCVGK